MPTYDCAAGQHVWSGWYRDAVSIDVEDGIEYSDPIRKCQACETTETATAA